MDPQAPITPEPPKVYNPERVASEAEPRVEGPTPKDNHWITILAMALFVLGSLAVVAFLYYQNQQLKNMLASYQTPATSPTPVATADPTANWKTYANQEYKFQLKYPSNWIAETTPIMPGAKYLTLLTLNTQYKLPSNYETSGVVFDIVYFDLSNKTINEWVEGLKTQGLVNAKVKGSGVINGYTFYEVEGLGSMYETKEFFVKVSDNKYLDLGLQPFPAELKQDLSALENTLNQILSTFKFLGASPTCKPRPACLDATPRCMIPETSDMCPPPTPAGKACTMEAKLCPNGSYVGRTGPNCEFANCP